VYSPIRRTTPPEPLRIAVMGTGRWGKNLIQALQDTPHARLAWLVDPDERALKSAHAIAPHARTAIRINDTEYDFDAVVIATPAPFHEAHARFLLEKGKHVLVEKPATLSLEGALSLTQTAAQNRVELMTGHQLLFHAGFLALTEQMRQGIIGEVQRISAFRTAQVDMTKEPGVVWSLGPHDIAMISTLLNAYPSCITCHINPVDNIFRSSRAEITLGFETGVAAKIVLSSTSENKVRTLAVHGTKGVLLFDDAVSGGVLTHIDPCRRRTSISFSNHTAPLTAECRHFVSAVETGIAPITGSAHIIGVAAILEACSRTDGDNYSFSSSALMNSS
jgi:predicted dehydrogenase